MRRDDFDVNDPFNLGHERYKVCVWIFDPFVKIVGAKHIQGRVTKIRLQTGHDSTELYPSGSKLGVWTKGKPANIIYEQIPKELKLIDVKHIEKIQVDVYQLIQF